MSKIPKLRFIKLSVLDAVSIIDFIDAWQLYLKNSGSSDPEYEKVLDLMSMIRDRLEYRLSQVQNHE